MQLQGVKFKVLKRLGVSVPNCNMWNNEIESEKWVYFTQLFE